MRNSRVIVLVLVVVVAVIVGFLAYVVLQGPTQACNSTWKCAAEYPLRVDGTHGVAGQQCVSSATYIYCVGGMDLNGGPRSEVYSSSISSSNGNVTAWTSNPNHYPQAINGQSCVAYSGYVYCVGGMYDEAGDDVAASYYAQLGSTGQVGSWNSTTDYPIPVDSQSCITSSSYIYCVGGTNETEGSSADAAMSNSVWYAHLSSSGISPWTRSTAYPGGIYYQRCFTASGYIYCLGGVDDSGNSVDSAYYAPLTPLGVGAWSQTTAYPVQAVDQACAVSSGYVYCVGGLTEVGASPSFTNAVYYASISSGGIGTWKQVADFPLSVATHCVVSSGNVYCVGGFDSSSASENGAVNYASLASLS